jgi:hypothetical protein
MARLVNNRTPKTPVITVIGEGITEQFYFRHIRSIFGYRYVLKPYFFGSTSLKQMERKIVEVVEGNGIAVCVFDVDVAQRDEAEQRKLKRLFHKYGRKPNVVFCESMPSIEFWFLIHYQNTNRHFTDAAAVETELRKFLEGYEKTGRFLERDRWVKELCRDEKLSTAMDRARIFGTNGQSWSNIYRAFDEFGKIHDP